MTRLTGTVKFFDDARGFGFVCPDDGSGDVFVHRSDLDESCRGDADPTLAADQPVSFEIITTAKGARAKRVSVATMGDPGDRCANGISITASSNRVRGRTSVAAFRDEIAYWQETRAQTEELKR